MSGTSGKPSLSKGIGRFSMADYILSRIKNTDIAKDRSKITMQCITDKGDLYLEVDSKLLGAIITLLSHVETRVSSFDVQSGPIVGETVHTRADIVEDTDMFEANVNGNPSILLGLQSGGVYRRFALAAPMATRVMHALEASIPNLEKIGDRN
jgi:hypothetical protein